MELEEKKESNVTTAGMKGKFETSHRRRRGQLGAGGGRGVASVLFRRAIPKGARSEPEGIASRGIVPVRSSLISFTSESFPLVHMVPVGRPCYPSLKLLEN